MQDTYAAAALRNPVLDLVAMSHLTDIRDWLVFKFRFQIIYPHRCVVESLGERFKYDYVASEADLKRMSQCSPAQLVKNVSELHESCLL
jgi:hypothetical protein